MPRKPRAIERRKLPSPLTLAEWAKNEEKRETLVELLTNPVLVEAFETLETAYSPSVPSFVTNEGAPATLPPEADLNNLLALRHAHRAGYFGFVNALRNLTRDRVLKRAERSPWGDLVPTE
jgi:hypothetical protein